jgi:alpha-beta hydrolase superfamily lysophospholipase
VKRIAAAGLLLAAVLAFRPLAGLYLEKRLIVPAGPGKPLPFEELTFDSGGRKLRGSWVPAGGPGLLIFHGNGESISHWAGALRLLHEAGIAAMVFDYSGYGNSEGPASLAHFHQDGLAAWKVFREKLPKGRRACAYGLSLGSAVLLDVASEINPDCAVVTSSSLSVLSSALVKHQIPAFLAPLVPDALDARANAARYLGPLLVVHGTDDALFPVAWAPLLQSAHPGARLTIIEGMRHADPVEHPSASNWQPAIDFVSSTLPSAR